MNNLNIGDTTNRNRIGKLFDLNLTGWQAVGINDVGNNKVLLWVNLENDLLSDQEIEKLQRKDYSKAKLHIQYPLLRRILPNDPNNIPRYWVARKTIRGHEYVICSEWYEQPSLCNSICGKILDIDGLKGLNNLKSISIGGINFSGLDNKIFIT